MARARAEVRAFYQAVYRLDVAGARARVPVGTLIDCCNEHDVVALVRALDRRDGVDRLAPRVMRLFYAFPPDERVLRRLSLMQQRLAGVGDEREFCVVLLFSLAMQHVCEHPHRVRVVVSVSPSFRAVCNSASCVVAQGAPPPICAAVPPARAALPRPRSDDRLTSRPSPG